MRPQTDTDWLIDQAKALGFDLCGVAPADSVGAPAHRQEWLERGYAGQMQYLHDPRRAHPGAALPEAKTVIVCAINYNTEQPSSIDAAALAAVPGSVAADAAQAAGGPRGWISRYAWGEDYHAAISEKLERLVDAMKGKFGRAPNGEGAGGEDFSVRAYVDTGPVSERVAARQAGLGWLAKNTCLINEERGSWLFLGVVLTSLEFAPAMDAAYSRSGVDAREAAVMPAADLCGNCRLCLDACPTGALVEPYVLDASRCISYLTIELRGSIPEEFRPAMGGQIFGCDICQDVCPWNRKAPASADAMFAAREKLVAPELEWLLSLSEEEFRRVFKGSPVKRTKWRGLMRNACVAAGNAARAAGHGGGEWGDLRARLAALAASSDAVVAEHARWALAQFEGETVQPIVAD